MKNYVKISQSGMVVAIRKEHEVPSDSMKSKYIENTNPNVDYTYRLIGGVLRPAVLNLNNKKTLLSSKIINKMNLLIEYLNEKYEQSKEVGTIADIKVELDYWKLHKEEYLSITNEAEKTAYIERYYPANAVYMRVKNRTLEEQLNVATYKRNLTHLASAKVEDLKSKINSVETEEEYSAIESTVNYIDSLKTVKEFMQVMGGE